MDRIHIGLLKETIRNYDDFHDKYANAEIMESIRVHRSALSKQVPMLLEEHEGVGYDAIDYTCPECGGDISASIIEYLEDSDEIYCPRCGQMCCIDLSKLWEE